MSCCRLFTIALPAVALSLLVGSGACATAPEPMVVERRSQPEKLAIQSHQADYLLTWRGVRIGDARERVRRVPKGWHYVRHERVSVRRGAHLVPLATTIAIDISSATSAHLVAERVRVEQTAGAVRTRAHAIREGASGWRVHDAVGATRVLPADAIPVELVPLLLRWSPDRHDRGDLVWSGRVFLTGQDFAVGHMRVTAGAAREFVVTLQLMAASGEHVVGEAIGPTLRGHWRTTRYGALMRARGADGVAAIRAHARELDLPFIAPDLIAAAAILVRDSRPLGDGPVQLRLAPVGASEAPSMPGQRVTSVGDVWHVQLVSDDVLAGSLADGRVPATVGSARASASDRGSERMADLARTVVRRAQARSQMSEVRALVHATDDLLTDDLSAPTTSAAAALAHGRGDCTAHAALLHQLLESRRLPARLVTGYRLDGTQLVRHRWNLVAIDGRWMAVDPTHGEVPARARLLGLAVHGASAAELAVIDATAFVGFADATAWMAQERTP